MSPPPTHALYGKYTGRIAVLPDFTEELLDPSLLLPEPEQPSLTVAESGEAASEDSDAD